MGPCSNHSEWWRLGWWLPTSWFFCPNSGPSRESQIFSPQQSHKMPAALASSCQWPPTRACLRLCHLKAFPSQTSASPHIPRSRGWLPCYSKLSEQPVLFSLLSFYFHNSNAQQCNKRSTIRYYYIHEQTRATLINSKLFHLISLSVSSQKENQDILLALTDELGLIQQVARSLTILPYPSPPVHMKLKDQR